MGIYFSASGAFVENAFTPARDQPQATPDISSLFPNEVLTACVIRSDWSTKLLPAEANQLGDVCEKRYAEFAAGRHHARHLMSMLIDSVDPLLIGDYRQPMWPSNIIGSISHSDEVCAVAVARRSVVPDLGLDVEPLDDLDPGVIDLVLTDREQRLVKDLGGWAGKLIFSIKESTYKCCYNRVRTFIDFKQCEVSIDPSQQTYTARVVCDDHLGNPLTLNVAGKWLIDLGHIFSSSIMTD